VKKKQDNQLPSHEYDYLVKTGMDPQVALELDQYEQRKGKRRKRKSLNNKEELKWK
jgi:hypothetical protein